MAASGAAPAVPASIELVRGVGATGILLHGDPDAPAGAPAARRHDRPPHRLDGSDVA